MSKSFRYILISLVAVVALGVYLLRADRYPDAKTVKASHVENDSVNPLDKKVEEALTLLQSGDAPPMTAIGMIREVLDEDPNHYSALLSLGLLSLQTGQYANAVERFERLLLQEHDNPRVFDAAAAAYLGVGDTLMALEQYRKMLNLELEQEVREGVEKTVTSLEKNL
jgi:Flp pilus assembly protein TadD